jgi:hypothetical protein
MIVLAVVGAVSILFVILARITNTQADVNIWRMTILDTGV